MIIKIHPNSFDDFYRGSSNSIVLQWYWKVMQYFSIATFQINAVFITKFPSIAKVLQYFQNVAKSKKYCKILKVLQQ